MLKEDGFPGRQVSPGEYVAVGPGMLRPRFRSVPLIGDLDEPQECVYHSSEWRVSDLLTLCAPCLRLLAALAQAPPDLPWIAVRGEGRSFGREFADDELLLFGRHEIFKPREWQWLGARHDLRIAAHRINISRTRQRNASVADDRRIETMGHASLKVINVYASLAESSGHVVHNLATEVLLAQL